MKELIREEVRGMKRYVAGKPVSEVKRELGLTQVVKMASNENPWGASPRVKEAVVRTLSDISRYPDSGSFGLRAALMAKTGVPMEKIFAGCGSDSLIKVISATFLRPGEEILMGEHSFSRYEDNALLMGARVVKSPMPQGFLDLPDMLTRITDKTRIIYLCCPNNPTGSAFGKAQFEAFLLHVPERVVLVLDEAYREYVTREDYFEALDYLPDHPRLIVLRTFSKAYGMASLRVGYGFAQEELVEAFQKVMDPFLVNLFAQEAAVAALEDEDFLRHVQEENRKGKAYFYEELQALNLPYVPSEANFVLFDTGRDDLEVFQALLRKGYIVRPGSYLGLPGFLRVTISTMEDNRGFFEALRQVLEGVVSKNTQTRR